MLAAAGGCYLASHRSWQGDGRVKVRVSAVQQQFAPQEIHLVGRTEPWRQAVSYFEVTGVVDEVFVEEGQHVSKGDPIAQLVLTDFNLALARAQAEHAVAQANLDLLNEGTRAEDIEAAQAAYRAATTTADFWRSEFERRHALFEKQAIAASEMEQARRERDAAIQAELRTKALWQRAVAGPRKQEIAAATAAANAASEAVALARRQLDKATLRAAFAGRIEKRMLDSGAYVNVFPAGGVPVVHLVDLTQVDAVFSVPEKLRNSLQDRQTVDVRSAVDPENMATGKVIALARNADESAGIFALRVRLKNPHQQFHGGMVVTATSSLPSTERVIRIPLGAVLHAYGQPPFVQLVDPTNKRVISRTVTLGPLSGKQVDVLDGLHEGDLLITHGHHRVVEGDEVDYEEVTEELIRQ